MSFLKKFRSYQSETTQFLTELKRQNSNLEESQRQGRALLWDKPPVDLDTQRRIQESELPQPPYVYQSLP